MRIRANESGECCLSPLPRRERGRGEGAGSVAPVNLLLSPKTRKTGLWALYPFWKSPNPTPSPLPLSLRGRGERQAHRTHRKVVGHAILAGAEDPGYTKAPLGLKTLTDYHNGFSRIVFGHVQKGYCLQRPLPQRGFVLDGVFGPGFFPREARP